MSYRVFARKYRPQTFGEVVGQEHITRTLQNAIRQKRIAQAYLFVGPRGIGKTSTARIFAKALNCLNGGPTPDPCGVCDNCREIAEGNSLDVVEIDGASNNSVENVRDLREKAIYAPARGNFKIYLIDEVHMLSIGAFNALLKILEEPPAHVKFLFATTEAHKVPATITSRCQRFDLRRIADEKVAGHLLHIGRMEGIELEEGAAWAIARGAEGSLRDAESMLDQVVSFCGSPVRAEDVLEVFGLASQDIVAALAGHVLRGEVAAALKVAAEEDAKGRDLGRLLEGLLETLRDVLVAQATHDAGHPLAGLAGVCGREKLLELIEHFGAVESQMRWASDKRMVLDVALIKGVHLLEQVTLAEVLESVSQIRRGERGVAVSREFRAGAAQGLSREADGQPALVEGGEKADVVAGEAEVAAGDPGWAAAKSDGGVGVSGKGSEVGRVGGEGGVGLPLAEVLAEVARELMSEAPLRFHWLQYARLEGEREGRVLLLVPEEFKSSVGSHLYANWLRQLDEALSKKLGVRVHVHVEFAGAMPTESTEPGAGADEVAGQGKGEAVEEATDGQSPAGRMERTQREEAVAARSDKGEGQAGKVSGIRDEEARRKMEEFRNDPLIKEALALFEAELVEVRRAGSS